MPTLNPRSDRQSGATKVGVRLLGTHVRKKTNGAPQKHHLDRRADVLAELGEGYDDDLLNTREVAQWLGVSPSWLEIGRVQKYGPKFVVLGPRSIKYRRGNVRAWLAARTHASTAEYDTGRRRKSA